MSSVSSLSRLRAGIASDVIATRSRTHTEESRVNSRLGSGSMRKSSWASIEVTRPNPPRTSSLRMPGGEVAGQLGRRAVVQQPEQVAAHRLADVEVGQRLGDRVVAGLGQLQGLGEQVGQVEHLDVAGPQRGGELVVLVLRLRHPGDGVEEELVVVARGEPLQLGPGAVQHDRAQPTDLAVGVVLGGAVLMPGTLPRRQARLPDPRSARTVSRAAPTAPAPRATRHTAAPA